VLAVTVLSSMVRRREKRPPSRIKGGRRHPVLQRHAFDHQPRAASDVQDAVLIARAGQLDEINLARAA